MTGVQIYGIISVLESVSPNRRYMISLTVGIGWSTGMLLVALVAYLVPDWWQFHLVTPLPILALLVVWL